MSVLIKRIAENFNDIKCNTFDNFGKWKYVV